MEMEIEAQDSLPSPPRKKKSRLPSRNKESAAEEEPKRRKHHRHCRHHHRHHRRHSKKEKGRDEGTERKEMVVEELEEGEILEVGEIEPEKPTSLAISGEDPLCNPDKELKALDYNSDALHIENKRENAHDSKNQESWVNHCEILGRKIEAVPVYGDANETKGRISLIMGENEVLENIHTERKELTDKEYDAGSGDLRSQARSISPFSGDDIQAIKQKDREEDNGTNSDHSPRRHRNSEQMTPSPSNKRHHSKDHHRHRSKSRDHDYDSSRVGRQDRHEVSCKMNKGHKERSSRSKHDDREDILGDYDRQKEMDREFRKERERSTSSSRHDRQDHGHSERDKERDTSKKHCRERDRSSSIFTIHDRQEHGHNERGKERDTSKEHHRERDRSYSISSGYDRQEHRHNERDRERETSKKHHRREMDRSFSISSIRDRREHGQSERDRERDMSKKHSREGDRSSSISIRHDQRKRKGGDSGSTRDRNTERPRDVSKERYGESDGLRDASRDRERDRYDYDRDRSRFRDWEVNLEDGRRHGRQIERDKFNSRDKQRSRHSKYDEWDQRRDSTRSKELKHTSDRRDSQEKREDSSWEEDEEDYQERIERQLAKQDEEDLEKVKEESRKKRQAIMEKYKQQQLQKHFESPLDDHPAAENDVSMQKDKQPELDINNYNSQALTGGTDAKQNSSIDYVTDPSFTLGKSPIQNGTSTPDWKGGVGGLGEGTPKSEKSADLFCDDIFGESPVGIQKMGKGDGLQIERSGLHDNWDDVEGYYSYRFGEVLDGRYEVIASHGKGVFSTVVRARDLKAGKGEPEEVAVKIIRSNAIMYKAGQEELKILGKLAATDPEDKRHCVRFLSSFKYRNHLCLVFESLHMNLREVLKKFGRNIGLKLTAVRTYAQQLFIALKHLKNCGVLHCDIKPDNMLVNEGKNVLKLCDFGNAMSAGKNEPTPYLVSRFYRAPEIILGLDYDHPMDMWSAGCCLYELYSGKVLFPGSSNNDMVRLQMELKGSFPKKMLRKGLFTSQHFDQDLNFHATEEDPVTRKTVKRLLLNIKPKDINVLISSSPGEDPKMVANFKDLLERIFVLDPEKRLTVSQALSHPFITGK